VAGRSLERIGRTQAIGSSQRARLDVGKTCLEAWAILHFLFTRPYCKIPCTAPTQQQLYKILWSEISKWLQRSELLSDLFEWTKTEIRFKGARERWLAMAKTAAKPENLQGFHDDHLLFVLDEASGIDDGIFEAVEGALTTPDARLLIMGNPTKSTGFFKRAFFEDRDFYYTMKVSSADSERVSSEYCQRLIRTYGMESNVVRVRVLGEFPEMDSDSLIALEWVEAAMNREPPCDENGKPIYSGELVLGVDVARFGDDETVLAARIGDTALPLKKWRKTDLMTTTGRIVGELERLMKKYEHGRAKINVDDTGVGGGVTDRLREVIREKKWYVTVTGCNNGGAARDKHYLNWGSESYFALRDRLQAGEIILPRDDEMAAQLSTRKYFVNSADKLVLERKDEFKKRLGRSPDRADALVLAFAPTVAVTAPPQIPLVQSYWFR